MIPSDLHFNFMDGMYGFVLAIFTLCLGWWLFTYRKNTLKHFASPEVLQDILIPRSRINFWAKIIALTLAMFLAVIAWMEPMGNGHYPPGVKAPEKIAEGEVRRIVHDVIFLVDASASMNVNDTRTKETRFIYAKEIVDEIVSRLRGENVALWAFTGEPTMLSPLTMDYLYVRLQLDQMKINEGNIAGTNFITALTAIRKEYFSTLSSRHRTLIIVSDGEDTELDRHASIEDLLGNADALNLHVYTVGLGTAKGGTVPEVTDGGKQVISRLNSELLKELAKRGRGEYYLANDFNAVQLAENLVEKIKKEGGFETIKNHESTLLGKEDLIYDLYFQLPLGAAILLLLFVLYFPDTRKKRVA